MAKVSPPSHFEMPTNNTKSSTKPNVSIVVQAYQAQPRLFPISPQYLFVDYNILYTACIIIIIL